jgi:hypothetical protein
MQVAIASLAFFETVVAPQAESTSSPPFLWDAVWHALLDAATILADQNNVCHHSVRTRFIQTIAQMYAIARSRFSIEEYKTLLGKLADFVATPVCKGESWPPSFLPPVQCAVLSVLPSLFPPPAKAGWDIVIDFLASQLRPLDSMAAESTITGGAVDAGSRNTGKPGVTLARAELGSDTAEPRIRLLWIKELSEKVLELFKSHMPWEVRAGGFQKLVEAYQPGVCLQRRNSASSSISKGLVEDFCSLVDMGLPAVHIAVVHKGSKAISEVRELLVHLALRAEATGCSAAGDSVVMKYP